MKTKNFIVKLEQEALHQRNIGNIKEAAKLFREIVNQSPNYEHGMPYYNLACCLEDLNELEEAEKNFIKSLEFFPDDPIRLGGYASFLYLGGNLKRSFDVFVKLFKVQKKYGDDMSKVLMNLENIRKKIGLTEQDVIKILNI